MASWLRIALAGLLAGAVTLHGNAGVAMVGCAPLPAAVDASPHVDHSGHSHAGVQVDHAPGVVAASHPRHAGDDSPGHAGNDDSAHADATHSKCSACAACCIAAMPSSATAPGVAAIDDTFASVSSAPQPTFLTGGLERPPRRFGA